MRSPGALIYVMGPSGAGKDSVMRYARDKLGGHRAIAFAHRYITRPAGEDIENYVSLLAEEFTLRRSRHLFALHWSAYALDYGIGVEIYSWRAAGLKVVIDGSREHFEATHETLQDCVPVLITASPEELHRRLVARGRDDPAEIDRRLARAAEFAPVHPALVTIDNSGPLARAGDALAALLD